MIPAGILGVRTKKSYDSKADAIAAARGTARPYLCPHCNSWHLTTRRWTKRG